MTWENFYFSSRPFPLFFFGLLVSFYVFENVIKHTSFHLVIHEFTANSTPLTLVANLVPRVLRLFGQRVGANLATNRWSKSLRTLGRRLLSGALAKLR